MGSPCPFPGRRQRLDCRLKRVTDWEIANVAIFPLSDEASFIYGAAPPVDGGMTAQPERERHMTIAMPRENASGAEPAEAVRALSDTILTHAAESEKLGRLAQPTQDGLVGANLFRMLLPRAFKGLEVTPPAFIRAIEAAAMLDGSTAWCLCQGNGCAMVSAYVAPTTARRMFGDDPRGILAWGRARPRRMWSTAATGSAAAWLLPAAAGTPPGSAATCRSSRPTAPSAWTRTARRRSAPCCSPRARCVGSIPGTSSAARNRQR